MESLSRFDVRRCPEKNRSGNQRARAGRFPRRAGEKRLVEPRPRSPAFRGVKKRWGNLPDPVRPISSQDLSGVRPSIARTSLLWKCRFRSRNPSQNEYQIRPTYTGAGFMQKLILVAIAVLTMTQAQSSAQEKSSAEASAFRKPGAGAERARLSFLVGRFTTEAHVLPGPMVKEEAVGTGTSVISWGLDSMFLFIDEQSVNPLLGNYKGFGVLGFDAKEQQYVLSMYNNFGDSPQYRGGFSGDTLSLMSNVRSPRKTFVQKVQWYSERGAVRLRVLNDTGQGFAPVVEQWARPLSGAGK